MSARAFDPEAEARRLAGDIDRHEEATFDATRAMGRPRDVFDREMAKRDRTRRCLEAMIVDLARRAYEAGAADMRERAARYVEAAMFTHTKPLDPPATPEEICEAFRRVCGHLAERVRALPASQPASEATNAPVPPGAEASEAKGGKP